MYKPTPAEGFNGWFKIPGYKHYLANREGFILNTRTKYRTQGSLEGRYLKVYIRDKTTDKPKLVYTHDLVCTAFHGPRPKGHIVNHKDGNKANPKAKNLSWITQSDNVKHAYKEGLKPSQKWAKA